MAEAAIDTPERLRTLERISGTGADAFKKQLVLFALGNVFSASARGHSAFSWPPLRASHAAYLR